MWHVNGSLQETNWYWGEEIQYTPVQSTQSDFQTVPILDVIVFAAALRQPTPKERRSCCNGEAAFCPRRSQ
jgi:hypothetical protein